MLINENYKVETDGDKNVILFKKIKKKTEEGEEQQYGWSVDGYYPTIKMALKDWSRKELFATELKDIQEVDDKLDEIHNIIKNLNL